MKIYVMGTRNASSKGWTRVLFVSDGCSSSSERRRGCWLLVLLSLLQQYYSSLKAKHLYEATAFVAKVRGKRKYINRKLEGRPIIHQFMCVFRWRVWWWGSAHTHVHEWVNWLYGPCRHRRGTFCYFRFFEIRILWKDCDLRDLGRSWEMREDSVRK